MNNVFFFFLGFLEKSTTSGVQWQWPVLGVFAAVLVFIGLGAAIKYKGRN